MQGYVKQTIRQSMQQSVGNIKIADFLGKDKSTVVNNIQKLLENELGKYGFLIKQFTINEIRPPKSVLTVIENKNIMAQEALKSKNELKKVEFEAKQQIEEAKGKSQAILMEAKSQAEANKKLAQSITPNLIKYKYVEKWSGKLSDLGSSNLPTSN
jgi:regulator of protease activity HflC (stomatin/prohibitin superfamily)